MIKQNSKKVEQIRIDFSLKREVFFVVIAAVIGAITFVIPKAIFETEMGLPYYLSWIVFGHVIGVYSSQSVIAAGIAIHIITAISIGIVVGIFLYKTGILIISKFSNGVLYSLLTGTAVFVIFYIPVQQFILAPETARTLAEMESPHITQAEASQEISDNIVNIMIGSLITHLVFGITLGVISSLLSIKFGARYRCNECDISFSRIDSYQKHIEAIHGAKPIKQKRILILGGGFTGVEVLKRLQKEFQNDVTIDITLVSKDNFFLFTPMLHEVSAGTIETRHIATPIRAFCKRARFYEANIDSIDLKSKEVVISHRIGKNAAIHSSASSSLSSSFSSESSPAKSNKQSWWQHNHTLRYDYLVIALGSETKFFGMKSIEENAFTMKNLGDAIILRNHILNMLEQADVEHESHEIKRKLTTFVVVGGGFGGVETIGAVNDFVRDSIKTYYHNIMEEDYNTKEDLKKNNSNNIDYTRIVLVSSTGRLLPEMDEELGEFALQKLRKSGVEVMLNMHAKEASEDSVRLDNGTIIPTYTLIWTAGVMPISAIRNLTCGHDKAGRTVDNKYLQIRGYSEVFAIGDCASVIDPNTGKPCPPTAQHAIRQAKIAAKNLISIIKHINTGKDDNYGYKDVNKANGNNNNTSSYLKEFNYKARGSMATIGKRSGVAILFGLKIHGFVAWWLWRTFYLANMPTIEKKLRVMVDWTIDIFFNHDVTRLKIFPEINETKESYETNEADSGQKQKTGEPVIK
jgi:NADH dehydrogenase FAD-containing subunit